MSFIFLNSFKLPDVILSFVHTGLHLYTVFYILNRSGIGLNKNDIYIYIWYTMSFGQQRRDRNDTNLIACSMANRYLNQWRPVVDSEKFDLKYEYCIRQNDNGICRMTAIVFGSLSVNKRRSRWQGLLLIPRNCRGKNEHALAGIRFIS